MDKYNIPGDTGGDWRLNKFVQYQNEAPSIHYRVLGEYFLNCCNPDKDTAVMLCWYMSVTYNEVTCILLNELFDWRSQTPSSISGYCKAFWTETKKVLDFGSSRKYAKNMDWFPTLMEKFIRTTHCRPYKWLLSLLEGNPVSDYLSVFKAVSSIPYTGRFAADLFLESVMYLQDFLGIELVQPSKLDWKRCSNLTSGLLNIFYLDEEANEYDKTKRLLVSEDFLTSKLVRVQKEISLQCPNRDNSINLFVGKICSFRNLFKASRYGGFHHDRELGVLRGYELVLPEYQYIWDRVFELRKSMFPLKFLGELNGWDGIRKERKNLWLREGLTGVE